MLLSGCHRVLSGIYQLLPGLRSLVLQRGRHRATRVGHNQFISGQTDWGMGVRHSLFPVPAFGTLFKVAGFPTPFSTASGVTGLVAGPSKVLQPLDFE
jgi:hypothetical protein